MSKDASIPRALPAAGLALVALHALALHGLPRIPGVAGTPLARNWGFNAWSYAPAWAQLAAYAAALLAVIPATNARLGEALTGAARAIGAAARRRAGLVSAAAVLAAMALFWALRQKYAFLGDGYLLASEVEAGHAGFPHAGALRLAIWVHDALRARQVAGVTALAVVSVLAGGLFVALALRFAAAAARSPGAPPGTAVAALAWMLAIGPALYFFGYVEVYAPLAALFLAFLAAGLRDLERGRPPLLATAVVLAGAWLHVLALACGPALVALWWAHLRARRPGAARALLAAAAASFVLFLAAYRLFPAFRPFDKFWLPLLPGNGKLFALLTPAHAVEVANAQLLGAPLAWVVLALAAMVLRPRNTLDERSLVPASLAATLLAGSLLFDFSLGARDWDLQAIAGVPLALLSTDLFFRRVAPRMTPRAASYVAVAVAALSALAAAPWIVLHHGERSRAWVEEALATDPNDYYRDKPPALALASMYGSAGLLEASLDVTTRALAAHPFDTRLLFNAGFALQRMERYAEAAVYFEQAARAAPGYPPPRKGLFICYDKMGRPEPALAAAQEFIACGGSEADVFGRAAGIAFSLCRFEECAAVLDAGIRAFPEDARLPPVRRIVAAVLEIAKRLPPGSSLASRDAILAAADERRLAGAAREAKALYELAASLGADSTRVRAGLSALGGG